MAGLEYWWMFPVSIGIASFSMLMGTGGALFFTPIFILVFGFTPPVAFGTALASQSVGFGSGVYGYARRGMINYKIALKLLIFALPFVIMGSIASQAIDHTVLKALFGIWVIISAYIMYSTAKNENFLSGKNKFVGNRHYGNFAAALAGSLLGLISAGMGNILIPWMNVHGKMPIKKTVATSIFIVFVSVLTAAIAYSFLVQIEVEMLYFTIPGVIIGGQIGPALSSRIDAGKLKLLMALIFLAMGLAMLSSVVS